MAKDIKNFKSKEAYRKFKAYVHIHNIPTKKEDFVYIAGKKHKIKHLG